MLTIRARRVAAALCVVIAGLAIAGVVGQVLRYRFNHDNVFGLVPLFGLDREANIPTWYSSVSLLIASALLAAVARARRQARDPDSRYWRGLAVIFLYLSVDEASSIHERLDLVPRAAALSAAFHYGWVVVGIAAVAVVGLLCLRFVLRLAPPIRRLFVLAGLLFVGGALGLELLEGYYASAAGPGNLTYALLAALEEVLEMAGVAVFIYALLRQLATEQPVVIRAE